MGKFDNMSTTNDPDRRNATGDCLDQDAQEGTHALWEESKLSKEKKKELTKTRRAIEEAAEKAAERKEDPYNLDS